MEIGSRREAHTTRKGITNIFDGIEDQADKLLTGLLTILDNIDTD